MNMYLVIKACLSNDRRVQLRILYHCPLLKSQKHQEKSKDKIPVDSHCIGPGGSVVNHLHIPILQ